MVGRDTATNENRPHYARVYDHGCKSDDCEKHADDNTIRSACLMWIVSNCLRILCVSYECHVYTLCNMF